jgi:hypothetical protein
VTNARGKNTRMGGSEPTFDGFQPPKQRWGPSRPSPDNGDRVFAACIQRCEHIDYGIETVLNLRRRKSQWQF